MRGHSGAGVTTREAGAPRGRPRVAATCRFCGKPLEHVVVDLGVSPLCERFLAPEQLNEMEPFYPLVVFVCDGCWLVQLEEYVGGEEIFSDYAYFSSYSTSWLEHAARYVDQMVQRFDLDTSSMVVELASNDGYLLRNFVEREIPCLGVEPAANVAKSAVELGVPTRVAFFGRDTASEMAEEGIRADLVVGNNVLAQVPDLNDFVAGVPTILASDGVATFEFPHLMRLVEENQFDTIYHEHYSYFSWGSIRRIFEAHGLRLFDVEELPTHGGSLRIYVCHADASRTRSDRAEELERREVEAGVESLDYYRSFASRVEELKNDLLTFLIEARREGRSVVGYGAPGKGNTLLNYCGIRTDLLPYTVDRSPHKQGKFLPGTRIPVYAPDRIDETRPDFLLILPWNLRDEIASQMERIRDWGGRFVVPIPEVTVLP